MASTCSRAHSKGSAEAILERLDSQLVTQINTADDNPTVLIGAVPPTGAASQQLAYYVHGHGVQGAVVPTANFEPLSWVLQVESLSVALAHVSQAVDLRRRANPAPALGPSTQPFLRAYRQVVSFLDKDRYLSPDVTHSAAFLRASGS